MKIFMNKNLTKIIIMSVLVSFDFFSSIEVAFFLQKSLTASEIYLIYAIFSVLIFLLEIPTGYVGDIIGYKKSIMLGLICGVIGFCGFSLFSSFFGIIISYFFMALMTSFISGSDEALLYDCLKEDKRENDFEKIYSKKSSFGYVASIVGSIFAGIIANHSMKWVIYIQIVIIILALIVLYDVNVSKFIKDKMMNLGEYDKISFSIKLVITLCLAGFFMTSTLVGTKFSQQIMLEGGIPITFFGIFSAMMTIFASIFSYIAPKIKRIPLIIIMIIPASVLIVMGIGRRGELVFLLFITSISRALGNIKITTNINQMISSRYRATINSIKSLLFRLFYSVIIFACGKVADNDVFNAVLLSGVILLILILGCLIFWYKYKGRQCDISETE